MEIKNYIKGLDPYKVKMDQADKNARAKKGGDSGSSEGSSGDKISLSNEAKLRTEAYQTAISAPEIRQAKVNAIKEQIASGNYTINARNIAEKMLAEEKDIFL